MKKRLSARDLEICHLLDQGVPPEEVAQRFNLSVSTVKRLASECRKISVSAQDAMVAAKTAETKVRELEERLAKVDEEMRSIRSELEAVKQTMLENNRRIMDFIARAEPIIERIERTLRGEAAGVTEEEATSGEPSAPPIEVSRIEVPRFEIPRKINLDATTLMYYVYTRALALKKTGKDLDLSSFINGTIRQFFESCLNISIAVVRKELGTEIEIPETVEVELSESGETHG